jgi:acetyl esterase/lipase
VICPCCSSSQPKAPSRRLASAGGHLALVAAMIAPDGPRPAPEPGVAAIVALNPVVDLLAWDLMVQAGNDCVLLEYKGVEHAFHYPGPAGYFDDVIDATAKSLLNRLGGRE